MTELVRTPTQLGTAIRRARKKLGLTQSELGGRCGLRQGTISLAESGNPAIRLDTLLTILAALRLDLSINTRPDQSSFDPEIEDLIG